jgi:Coenzyme F420 hydrogenase/dehydrogenase, beta subunit C terminus.
MTVKYLFENGDFCMSHQKDPYMRAFLKALDYMPSCYTCQFACLERASDITIADFWGAEFQDIDIDLKKGVSLVISNTPKGALLIDELQGAKIIRANLEKAAEHNKNLVEPTKKPAEREIFLLLAEKDFKKAADKYAPISFKSRIAAIIPKPIKKIIKKMLGR